MFDPLEQESGRFFFGGYCVFYAFVYVVVSEGPFMYFNFTFRAQHFTPTITKRLPKKTGEVSACCVTVLKLKIL